MIDNIAWSAVNAKRGLQIPIVLSGDTHHYSRYSGSDGVTQFITSGGGGAFLHPTHQLADTVELDESAPNRVWLGGKVKSLKLRTAPSAGHADCDDAACYPSRPESLELLKGNFKFVRLNSGFCVLLGAIYWLLGLVAVSTWPDSLLLVPLTLGLGFWTYTRRQEGNSARVKALSAANGVVHAVVLVHNDAFSSMRLDGHRNFLRMRIKDDEVKIYPIGLTKIPKREDWRINTGNVGSPPPAYVPATALAPHLIEGPIVISTGNLP